MNFNELKGFCQVIGTFGIPKINKNSCTKIKNKNQTACGHPNLNRLSDNSISGQKHVKTKMYKAFKSKKEEIEYYSE